MKEKRKREINEMANAIDNRKPEFGNFELKKSTIDPRIVNKKADEIIAIKKLEIPKTALTPTNGRIYVKSVAGNDMKTPGGLILPPTFAMQKNDEVEGVQRYFVVAWDADEIPENIKKYLSVGIEVNPFLPWEAQEWKLPRVVDWETGNIFDVIHYTELAGISLNKPKPVED